MFEPIYDFLYNVGLGLVWFGTGLGLAGLMAGAVKALNWISEKVFSK